MDKSEDARPPGAPLSAYTFKPGSAADLQKYGGWFRDKDQRYCLFRGANLSSKSKLPPYLPLRSTMATARTEAGTSSPPFDCRAMAAVTTLKQAGLNVIRLVVPWKAVTKTEPGAGLNDSYLQILKEVIDCLYSNGMFVLIDFHQDLAHELYGGDGFPNWAMAVDDDHPTPDHPPDPSRMWQLGYALNGDIQNTLISFWNDSTTNTAAGIKDFRTRTTFLSTVEAIVEHFANSGATRYPILGYELFNEPDQVGEWDKKYFEEQVLTPFYRCGYERLKARDPQAYLFIEPRVDWNVFPVGGLELPIPVDLSNPNLFMTYVWQSRISDLDRIVFSFHFYDPITIFRDLWLDFLGLGGDDMQSKQRDWPDAFKRMIAAAGTRNMIPFMTEYGAEQYWDKHASNIPEYPNQSVAYLDLQLQQIEATLLNAMQWVCEPYYGDNDGWNREKFSMLDSNADLRQEFRKVIPRPYPLRSSALPTLLRFDSRSSQAALAFTGALAPAPTVIYLPQLFHYPDGFEVRASCANPATDLRWDTSNSLLYWNPAGDRAHYVVVSKPGEFNKAALPASFPVVGDQPPWIWCPR